MQTNQNFLTRSTVQPRPPPQKTEVQQDNNTKVSQNWLMDSLNQQRPWMINETQDIHQINERPWLDENCPTNEHFPWDEEDNNIQSNLTFLTQSIDKSPPEIKEVEKTDNAVVSQNFLLRSTQQAKPQQPQVACKIYKQPQVADWRAWIQQSQIDNQKSAQINQNFLQRSVYEEQPKQEQILTNQNFLTRSTHKPPPGFRTLRELEDQKKVVKVCYNGDMKRLKMTQDYASLVEQTHKAFGKGSLPAEFKFYYMDEDNEMISINSQADFEEALSIEDFGALKLTVAGSTKEAQAQLCQKMSDTQSMRESLNQSGLFAPPVQNIFQSPFGRGFSGLELQSMPSTDQLLTERAPIMRSAFQDDFENIESSDKVVSAKIVEPVEEKKAEEPAAEADQELPKCARKGCNLRKHTVQKHGWCCGACRNKGKHGGGCQNVKFVGNGEVESSESEGELVDKNNGDECVEQEEIECWKCFGKKINKKGKDCKKCEGTGVMRSNIFAKVVTVVRSEVREYCDSAFQGLLSEYIVNKRQEQAKVEHEGYECDGCEVAPIKGIRYKCSVCPDYDLCETCEAKGTHAEHPMLKVRQPSHAPAQLLCQYKNIPSTVIPSQAVPQQKAQEEPKPRGFGTKKVEKSFVKYSGRFVKESFGDNHKVAPGQKITKSWTFRNDGQTQWPEDTLFIQTNGDDMKAQPVVINQVVAADSEHVWEVELTAPEKEGRYQCFFRMVTGNNYRFGHKVWAELLVEKVAVEEKPKAVVCDFIAEAVKDIKDSMHKEQEAVFKPEVEVLDASVYPVIEVESTDKSGGESPLNVSIKALFKASGLMTPKEIYNKKAEAVESIVVRQGLTDLFELGFVNFEVNKSMLAKYNNDTQVVAGYLCEGILSESCINEVFNQ